MRNGEIVAIGAPKKVISQLPAAERTEAESVK
jgi:hypothetical protein